jgi:hypothetical protein
MSKEIKLRGGGKTIVDDNDFEMLNQYKWSKLANGNNNNQYYAIRLEKCIGRKGAYIVRMHREIMRLKKGDKQIIDHIDGNGLNNCKSNLRITTASINCQNQRSRTKKNRTGYIGVTKQKNGKWRSEIGFEMSRLFLGIFDTPINAAKAYDNAAIFYFGSQANTNFPISQYTTIKIPLSIVFKLTEKEREMSISSVENLRHLLFANPDGS